MNRLTELFLVRRGLTEEKLKSLNDAGHDRLLDVDKVVDVLHSWKEAGTKVVVLPDFDMDGISAGVLGHAGLCELGFDCELFEPNPKEGYGFFPVSVDRLVREHPGVGAVITCDVGITCVDGAKRIRDLGLDLIITDHHEEPQVGSARSLASACVDPCRLDEEYGNKGICGAHVLWQVLDAYAHKYGTRHDIEQVSRLRAFAAIGTVSDMMPLVRENRQLVLDGVDILRMAWSCGQEWADGALTGCPEYVSAFAGIGTMCDAWRSAEKLRDVDALDEGFIGFYMAPAFNACKRMDEPLSTAFAVFGGDGAEDAAERLLEVNEERKKLVEDAMDDLLSSAREGLAPFVYVVDAPPGVLGLLASKVLEIHGMPCVVVSRRADGSLSGSGRSPAWYPFLTRASGMCAYAAGHEGAFGVGFTGMRQLSEFARWIEVDATAVLEESGEVLEAPASDIIVSMAGGGDCGLDVPLISEFVNDMQALRPFGHGFEAPRILLRFDAQDAAWMVIGREQNHCKAVLPYGIPVLIWKRADLCENGAPSGVFELQGRFAFNEFNGNVSLQFITDKVVKCGEVA